MKKLSVWTVNHHLPGRRYGSITILLNDETVAKMWGDNPKTLRLAKRIVAAMNAADDLDVGATKPAANIWCVQSRDRWCATQDGSKPSRNADVDRTACNAVVAFRWGSAKRRPTCEECLAALGWTKRKL